MTERWTTLVTRVLAPNAGPMTLDGTNSLVVRAPGSPAAVVIDPGPDDDAHMEALTAAGDVELILLTHHHHDHTEAAARFAQLTGAPVRAYDPRLCIDGPPLDDGEVITAGGARIEVVFTPGHTADSVSLHLPEDEPLASDATSAPAEAPAPAESPTSAAPPGSTEPTGTAEPPASTRRGSMITGDTILGRGTTIIAHPDGSLGSYLRSLDRLKAYGAITVLPAHGPMLGSLADICRTYTSHRRMRLDQVRATLTDLGLEPSGDPAVVKAVADTVYADIDTSVRFAAEASVRAQLEHLVTGPLA
ncbi:glyoxylase-like metal-dependent hydrolase (beta-lactamase superfamily II) [Microbacterium invictum]|uniref:Glyoxylase-like metal-dependent hydrolase (Beta-lactamase superfamily II) n=1 Tax=Microbacterium invictum TaxID=515415 RepID=A0AA40VP69_9MICO|nr:MBL fold metallo-hydrolase [Microbacterium invictum]MBB4141123.1 glyoxylase-like metal-dependent hydrolase (beta-lactamase superfamily II) [Microbacterium invictum]